MAGVLEEFEGISQDVLLIENRSSEPFDLDIDPTEMSTITWTVGQVAGIGADGFVKRADKDDIATVPLLGLFMLPRNPNDETKNNYIDASNRASIFSNGIVTLTTQISDASVTAAAVLYIGDDGQITTTTTANGIVGRALSSRTVAGAAVRVKLEL